MEIITAVGTHEHSQAEFTMNRNKHRPLGFFCSQTLVANQLFISLYIFFSTHNYGYT